MENKINRRKALRNTALGVGALTLGISNAQCGTSQESKIISNSMKGNINHSVCRWCYGQIPLEELAERSAELGIKSVELTKPDEWHILEKHGLTCALGTESFANIVEGFNNQANHEKLIKPYMGLIDQAADKGIPTVIVFSGNRKGISDEAGWEACATGLDAIVKHAEKKGVMVVMELLNSKVNHKDYQCDNTPWGAALVDKIGSPNFKLLYDIYHMQIMEGDIIATIQEYKDYIAHYHTGGVPGRHEINQNQELNYPAIMRAIVDTGYKGYVAQEFIPSYEDQIAALKEGITICDV